MHGRRNKQTRQSEWVGCFEPNFPRKKLPEARGAAGLILPLQIRYTSQFDGNTVTRLLIIRRTADWRAGLTTYLKAGFQMPTVVVPLTTTINVEYNYPTTVQIRRMLL